MTWILANIQQQVQPIVSDMRKNARQGEIHRQYVSLMSRGESSIPSVPMTRASWLAGEATAFGVQTHTNDVTKRRGLFIRIRHTHSQLGMDTWDHPDPFSSNTKTSNSAPINTPLCTPPCRLATPRQTTFPELLSNN
jgi:hypothetical protein